MVDHNDLAYHMLASLRQLDDRMASRVPNILHWEDDSASAPPALDHDSLWKEDDNGLDFHTLT